MTDCETRRLEKIKRNQVLFNDLGLEHIKPKPRPLLHSSAEPKAKRQKLSRTSLPPSRVSARIASAPAPIYNDDALDRVDAPTSRRSRPQKKVHAAAISPAQRQAQDTRPSRYSAEELTALQSRWSSWTPSAPPPTRESNGTFHFSSHPVFRPNKSPTEMLREGVFGGSYFRPLYSTTLKTTISDDWNELPADMLKDLDMQRYLYSEEYDPEINKYGVKCGQSIEEWEASGWIMHEFDVRGWFQWYIRFFGGRRCEDDERQVGRWDRCVGERGRWRRRLLKAYMQKGVKSVADEGDDDDAEISPTLHQTCLHWAWELRQDVLDETWQHGL